MYLKSIAFNNIKKFGKLTLDFTRPDGSFAGWNVFVGGNTTGKSTLLQGMAMACLGPHIINFLAETRYFTSHGQSASEINAEFVLPDQTTHVKMFLKNSALQKAKWDMLAFGQKGLFAAGYGPMRRLSGGSPESLRLSQSAGMLRNLVTLFREDAALSEGETWLKTHYFRTLESNHAPSRQLLEAVITLLNDGLLPYDMKISRITVDHVLVRDGDGPELPMDAMSDGCKIVYSLVLDLIQAMAQARGVEGLFVEEGGRLIVDCPGLVLIDEIEAHLHPSWQRDLPEWLKSHFPKVQFMVATHSPLVAQAADPNGIIVLPAPGDRDPNPRVLTGMEYERLRLGRAEKTLLGVAFGLQSVRSRWANRQIARWQTLDAKLRALGKLPETEAEEHHRLREQMTLAFDRLPDHMVP
ncbi:MAG: AAA family ATPase [Magnetococcales bacterium]|nr:AAA family ATPase [Magnetococcales bacterium]